MAEEQNGQSEKHTDSNGGDKKSKAPLKDTEKKLHYKYVQLNPASDTNPSYGFGIEVTSKRLQKKGVPNLVHHGIGTSIDTPSACQQALICDLPDKGATVATQEPDILNGSEANNSAVVATVKLDKDVLAAMAVLESRKGGGG